MQLCRPSPTEQIGVLRPGVDEQKRRTAAAGSGAAGKLRSEITHHMAAWRNAGAGLGGRGRAVRADPSTMPHLLIGLAGVERWPVQPRVVVGEQKAGGARLPAQRWPSPAP